MRLSCGSELWKLNSNLNVKIKYSTIDKILLEGGWLIPHYNFFPCLTEPAKMLLVFPLSRIINIYHSVISTAVLPEQITPLIILVMPGNLPTVDIQLQRAEILFNLKCISYVVVLCSTVYTYLQSSVKEDSAKTTSALTRYSAQNN